MQNTATKTSTKTAVGLALAAGLAAAGFIGFQMGGGQLTKTTKVKDTSSTSSTYSTTGNDVGLTTQVDVPEVNIPLDSSVPPVITVPGDVTAGVKISEFHRTPGTDEAFVELFNGGPAADVTGWRILGPSGEVHVLSGVIGTNDFVSEASVSNRVVILVDDKGALIDADVYQIVDVDQAWADQGDNMWQCTATPSEAAANVVDAC